MTRDLVIFRSGARSLHALGKDPQSTAPWDIYVCPFEALPDQPAMPGLSVGHVISGPKWSGLRELLQGWAGWRDYRYIMLADDDLLMSEAGVTAFFEACASLGAKLAQPALTEQSEFTHVLTLQNSAFLARRVTFVEIMAPCFRADVLQDLLWTLDLTETGWGWGLDALWPKLLAYEDVFIVDATPIVHTRPVGRARANDLEARLRAEEASIFQRFNCSLIRKTRAGRLLDGRTVAEPDPALLHLLLRGYDRVFERHPEVLLPFIAQQLEPLQLAA